MNLILIFVQESMWMGKFKFSHWSYVTLGLRV